MVYEDFDTYTQVDPNAHITVVGNNHIDFIYYRNETAYIYKDFTVNHFTDFEHLIINKISSIQHSANSQPWGMANALNDRKTLQDLGEDFICCEMYYANPTYYYKINYFDGVANTVDSTNLITLGTTYYLKVSRAVNVVTVRIYTDSDRTILLDTLSINDGGNPYQYLYGGLSYNSGHNLNANLDQDNYNLQEVTPTSTDKNIPTYFNSKFITHH